MSILSVDNISPIGSGTSVTVNSAATLNVNNVSVAGITTLSTGLNMTPATSNLYQLDGTLSYYGTTNAVYLNGAGDTGWLRLSAAGTSNDRTSINIYGQNVTSVGDTIQFKTNSQERLRINANGHFTFTNGNAAAWNTIQRYATTLYSGVAIQDADSTQRMQFGVAGGANQIATGAAQHDVVLKSYANLLLATNQTERLRITSDGIIIFGSSGAPNNANTVSIHPSDGMINFGMDGRSSYVTGTSSCYIYSGEGSSGTTLAGELYLQSRSNVDRDIVFVTGSTPAERLRVHSSGALGIAGKNYGTSGQVLMSQGTGSAIQWASPAYIIHDVWALSSSMTTSSTETKVTTWTRANAYSATIGSAMTESSGIFTFPETGIYKVVFDVYFQTANTSRYISYRIYKVISATSTRIAQKLTSVNTTGSQWYQSDRVEAYFDVTNVSTHKIEFTVASENATTLGSGHAASVIQTAAYFTKIGDT